MDPLHYWAIAESDIEIQNPITDRKLRLLDDYCDIRDGLSVLDIGCGKAWLLRQWAEKHAIEGVGIDVNPRFIEVARRKLPARGRLTFHSRSLAGFEVAPESYDIVICLGASFAIGDAPAALDWMIKATKPGGTIVFGDITTRHQPAVPRGEILPLEALAMMGVVERHGAEVSATISASEADFERYASHHRHASLRWARANPTHPAQAEVLQKSRADWQYFQQTVRKLLGWTIFVGRKFG